MKEKLTAFEVEKLQKLGKKGRYGVGDGLYLNIAEGDSQSWLFRYQLDGKRRWKGLGGVNNKNLAKARKEARKLLVKIGDHIDPIDEEIERDQAKLDAQIALDKKSRMNEMTFERCSLMYIEKQEAGWTNPKHAQQWRNTLKTYAYPFIGNTPINDIDIDQVEKCLNPIWYTKTETAKRLRQRIETVLDAAVIWKCRNEKPNPAAWERNLKLTYPSPQKLKEARHLREGTAEHLPALPYKKIPACMSKLEKMEGCAPLALRFAILTAARSGEIRFATWDEIDLKRKLWVVPSHRMKAKREHKVTLSETAIELIKNIPKFDGYVFPGRKIGKALSDGGMRAVLQRMGRNDITVHGFRSSFRDYIGEETGFPHRVAEFALAHGLTDETEKAYARGELLKKRFKMMNAWAAYATSAKSNIVHIAKRA
jgi:integrase